MHCAAAENLLDLYLEKRLSPARMKEVAAHLADCPACSARAKRAPAAPSPMSTDFKRDLKERLSGAGPARTAPPAAAGRRSDSDYMGHVGEPLSPRLASLWYRVLETTLLALALLLPLAFYLRAYDSAAVKTAILEAGVLVLIFGWLFKGLERGRWELPASTVSLLAPAAALLAWTALRFAASPYKTAALPGLLEQCLGLGTYAVVLLEFGGVEAASRFADWALGAAWAAGLYGAAQRLGLDPFAWSGAYGSRVFSTLANPDLFAFFLALALPLTLTKLLDPERDGFLKKADLALLFLLGGNLLWTGSSDGLAAFTVMGACAALALPAFLPSRASTKVAWLSLAVTVAVLAAAAAAGRPFAENFSQRVEFKRRTWAATARMIAESPWAGQGPGGFSTQYPRFRAPEITRWEGGRPALAERPQSQILEVTAELGLVGAALWAWLFGAVLSAAWRARRSFLRQGALEESCYLAGLFAAAAGHLICSQLGLGTWQLAPGWFLWPLTGLLAGLSGLAKTGGSFSVLPLPLGEAGRRRLYAPALFAFAGLAVFPGLWLRSDVEYNIASYFSRQKQWAEALAHYDRVWPGSGTYVLTQYAKGAAYLGAGRPEQALAQYAAIEALAPNEPRLHYQEALAYAALDEWPRALASHERAAKLDPLFIENYVRWSEAAKAAGDLSAARRAAYSAIALEPREPAHWLALSEIYMKERRVAAARRLQKQAARLRSKGIPGG